MKRLFFGFVLGAAFVGGICLEFVFPLTPSKAGEQKTSARVARMKATAYCPCRKCCGKFSDGKTATGTDARMENGVAADPKLLPYGTKLDIPGVGKRTVDDTGGAMRQSSKKGIFHIDVRFSSHKKAKAFGAKWLNVKVLGKPSY